MKEIFHKQNKAICSGYVDYIHTIYSVYGE